MWNTEESLIDGVWYSLNPDENEPPILSATDMRINPMDRARQGLLARSRMIRDKESIAPRTLAWIRNADGEPAGNFLMAEEATIGEFVMLESEPTWI